MKAAKMAWFENHQPAKQPSRSKLTKLCENMLWQVARYGGDETYGYFRARLVGNVLELDFVIESFTGVPEAMFDERLPAMKFCQLEIN